MLRSTTAIFLGIALLLPAMTSAAWWWPFGSDTRELPAVEQTIKARPIYDKAVELNLKGRKRAAAKRFEQVWEDYPGSDMAADALYNYGQICYERKKWKNAFKAFQRLLIVYPDFPDFNQVILTVYRIALANAEGDHIKFAWIIPFRAYDRAANYFENVVTLAPYSDLAPLALMNVALIRQYKGDIPEAIDALDRLINLYPESLLADDAYLELGDTFSQLADGPLYDQGATRESVSYFEDFLILFPDHEKVGEGEHGLAEMQNLFAESKLVIGKYYFVHQNAYRSAEIFFNNAVTISPNSKAADEARRYLARIEEYKAAIAADPNFVPPRTSWKDRLLFWKRPSTDLTPEQAEEASAKASEAASPASGSEAGSIGTEEEFGR